MRTIARFIGENGSLGFINGSIYELHIGISNDMIWINYKYEYCPYETLKSFLQNWEVIQ